MSDEHDEVSPDGSTSGGDSSEDGAKATSAGRDKARKAPSLSKSEPTPDTVDSDGDKQDSDTQDSDTQDDDARDDSTLTTPASPGSARAAARRAAARSGAGDGTDRKGAATPKRATATAVKKPNVFARFARFMREVVAELRKVIWPTRRELITYTWVVIVFVAIIATIVGIFDYGFGRLVLAVFGS